MSLKRLTLSCAIVSSLFVLAAGCGSSTTPDDGPAATSAAKANASQVTLGDAVPWTNPLPTASIPAGGRSAAKVPAAGDGPAKGSPEWLLADINRLRVQPAPESDDADRLRGHRRWKNERIIERAQEVIALTHADPEKLDLFNTAVTHLMEARLVLALQAGDIDSSKDRQHVDALYSDARSLYERDPQSKAAAEAAFIRARYANRSAERFAATDARWLEEFARQARLFAEQFPQETERALALLDAAGRSCELHHLRNAAINCYAVLDDKYPETPEGRQATAILRRLQLNGQKLTSFAGPTLEGGYARIDDYRGRCVIVAFWASHSQQCVEQFPRLSEFARKWDDSQLAVLGVNLDTDEEAARTFLGAGTFQPTTIFWHDASRRSWNNPLVEYYGVRDIPLYWLIDVDGVVVGTMLSLDELEEQLARVMKSN